MYRELCEARWLRKGKSWSNCTESMSEITLPQFSLFSCRVFEKVVYTNVNSISGPQTRNPRVLVFWIFSWNYLMICTYYDISLCRTVYTSIFRCCLWLAHAYKYILNQFRSSLECFWLVQRFNLHSYTQLFQKHGMKIMKFVEVLFRSLIQCNYFMIYPYGAISLRTVLCTSIFRCCLWLAHANKYILNLFRGSL